MSNVNVRKEKESEMSGIPQLTSNLFCSIVLPVTSRAGGY